MKKRLKSKSLSAQKKSANEYVVRNGEKITVREDGVAGYVDDAGMIVAGIAFAILAIGFVAGAGIAVFKALF